MIGKFPMHVTTELRALQPYMMIGRLGVHVTSLWLIIGQFSCTWKSRDYQLVVRAIELHVTS